MSYLDDLNAKLAAIEEKIIEQSELRTAVYGSKKVVDTVVVELERQATVLKDLIKQENERLKKDA